MTFCIHIDIDIQDVPHEIVKWHLRSVEFLPSFKFWKKWDYCKMTFIIGRSFAECQIQKKWNWPDLLNWVEYFDRLLCKHWYYQDLAQEIVKCHFSSVKVLPSSKFWKSENGPSLELSGILWWNFAHTLVYWQDVGHEIVKWHLGLVEVLPMFKFWKKWKLTLKPFGIFWSNVADNLMLKRSSPRNCKMTFIIGRGFAECQILKK